jgi:hypothetical protein
VLKNCRLHCIKLVSAFIKIAGIAVVIQQSSYRQSDLAQVVTNYGLIYNANANANALIVSTTLHWYLDIHQTTSVPVPIYLSTPPFSIQLSLCLV